MNAVSAVRTPPPYRAGRLRDFALPIAVALFIFLIEFQWIWIGLVVLGQAHFFTTYVYQYKGKKMNRWYSAAAIALALASVAYFVLNGSLLPIMLTAAVIFAAHFAFDEFTLHGETLTREKAVTLVGFAILHLSFLTAALFPAFAPHAAVSAGLFFVAVLSRVWFGSAPASPAEKYLWFVGAILFICAFTFGIPGQLLGVILLLHFLNWYIGYGERLKEKPERARSYWIEVWGILALATALYVGFSVLSIPWLQYLFEPAYFYAWAIAHIVLSFKAS